MGTVRGFAVSTFRCTHTNTVPLFSLTVTLSDTKLTSTTAIGKQNSHTTTVI